MKLLQSCKFRFQSTINCQKNEVKLMTINKRLLKDNAILFSFIYYAFQITWQLVFIDFLCQIVVQLSSSSYYHKRYDVFKLNMTGSMLLRINISLFFRNIKPKHTNLQGARERTHPSGPSSFDIFVPNEPTLSHIFEEYFYFEL